MKILIIILIIITIVILLIINPFKKVENNLKNEKEIDNETLEAPTLSPDVKIPDNKIDISNFDTTNENIKKEQLIGIWKSESQDFVGEIYPFEGITLIFTENSYQKLSSENAEKGSYSLNKNEIVLDNKKLFVNIKNEKLILIYPEYPKAEIYVKVK